jgi:PPK2 family polyphosphate:nucleotide phosphotransferase
VVRATKNGKTSIRHISRAYRIDDVDKFRLKDFDPDDTGGVAKVDSSALLAEGIAKLQELQSKMYAQNQWSLLLILQGLDASGKDSAIKHVMSGVNPMGCRAFSFKAPTSGELDHDFLWRHVIRLPERGQIGIFNRSYYEEVLVVRVHPEILAHEQLPDHLTDGDVWQRRFKDIRAYERHLADNGTVVRKFYLNISKKEQRQRFEDRLNQPDKNWKFNIEDLRERQYWDQYMGVYEDMIRHTSRPEAPWYVVPADHKWFTRLVVADAVIDALEEMKVDYPKLTQEQEQRLEEARRMLETETD